MRGESQKQATMLSLVSPETRVPSDHPLRDIKRLADEVLDRLTETFDVLYSSTGRPSIPPENLLKSTVLMALYSIPSERRFCEQLDYNLLFRWFLDMGVVDDGFDHSVFSKNRQRLLEYHVADLFFMEIVELAREQKLLSAEHFTVDGTLIDAWASMKSFTPKTGKKKPSKDNGSNGGSGNSGSDFKGETRSNQTHESCTDPDARLYKKSKGSAARLCHMGHALMENRHGLLMDIRITQANGRAERETAIRMLDETLPGSKRIPLGAYKGYDTREFVEQCRMRNVTPHVSQNTKRKGGSGIDQRTTRHGGYRTSQRVRKRVEEIFGWLKEVGGLRKSRFVGREKTQLAAYLAGAAYNLLRISRRLNPQPAS